MNAPDVRPNTWVWLAVVAVHVVFIPIMFYLWLYGPYLGASVLVGCLTVFPAFLAYQIYTAVLYFRQKRRAKHCPQDI